MDLSRRALLLTGALTAGCRLRDADEPSAPDPDVALRAAALATEVALLAAYQQVMTSRPRLRPRLQDLAAHHAVHVAELSSGPLPTAPASTARTVAALATLERSAATEHGRGALAASRSLAPLLASLSASSSCAVAVL